MILVGTISSRPFVDYMAYVASMGFENGTVPGNRSVSDANLIYDLGHNDTVLVLPTAPCAAKSIKAAQQLRSRGAYVIGITDSIGPPLCQFCHSSFFVSTQTPQFFTSYTATLVLLEMLVGLVVTKGCDPIRNRIAEIEAMRFVDEECYPRPKTK